MAEAKTVAQKMMERIEASRFQRDPQWIEEKILAAKAARRLAVTITAEELKDKDFQAARLARAVNDRRIALSAAEATILQDEATKLSRKLARAECEASLTPAQRATLERDKARKASKGSKGSTTDTTDTTVQ